MRTLLSLAMSLWKVCGTDGKKVGRGGRDAQQPWSFFIVIQTGKHSSYDHCVRAM